MTSLAWNWGVSNSGADALLVWLEPWAEEFEVSPRSTLTLDLADSDAALEEVEYTEGRIVLWAKAGQTVRVSIDGIVQQSASADIAVPVEFTKELMTLMFQGSPQARLAGASDETPARTSLWRLQAIRITAFATASAILYGILHDQVTAHLCVEYFTVAHPPIFPTTSPFLLALGWGLIATWWVGLVLGLLLAAAARIGPAPRLGLNALWRPILMLMLASGAAAMLMGLIGAWLVASGRAEVPGGWGAAIPWQKHASFSFDAWAHATSYAAGALGGLFLVGRTVWIRVTRHRAGGE